MDVLRQWMEGRGVEALFIHSTVKVQLKKKSLLGEKRRVQRQF